VTLHVTGATENDARELAPKLRAIDVKECKLLSRMNPEEALLYGVRRSSMCWAFRVDGDLVAIVGCVFTRHLAPVGRPWFLATDDLWRHRRWLLRYTAQYLDAMKASGVRLENTVLEENQTAIRWLRKIGFTTEAYSTGVLLFYWE
jgi:ribosomal protein S18 acetylase RimI-like enzyme